MRYVVDLPVKDDCKDCPFFGDVGDMHFGRGGRCSLSPITVYDSGRWVDDMTYESSYRRPRNCPLRDVDDYFIGEWMKSVNSQPEKDERIVTLRMELYESEDRMLSDMAFRNGLSVAQQVAKLIEDEARRVADGRR